MKRLLFAAHPRKETTMADDDWSPTRWWRAVGPDGELWCESSDEKEVRDRARPGDRVQHLWSRTEHDWRPTP